jgi:hypothetical protein
MAQIRELSAAQLARHATNVFLFAGRHRTGARLIFRALELEPYQPQALRGLSDLLDREGTEQLSAAVLEYALAQGSPISADEKKELDDLLFLAKWTWKFSRHEEGATGIAWEDLADRSKFIVDDQRYDEFLGQIVTEAGSIESAFRSAHTLIGVMGGLLEHRELGSNAPLDEVLHPEKFRVTTEYEEWLLSDTAELEELERARKEQVGRGNP